MSQAVTATPAVSTTSAQYNGASASAGGAGAGGTGSGTTVLVPDPPPALSALSKGQVVRGVVGQSTGDGQVLLETRYGRIPVLLADAPPRGTVLQFQITQSGNPTELTLIDGRKGPPKSASGAFTTQAGAQARVGDTVTVRPVAADGAGRTPPSFQAQIVQIESARTAAAPGTSNAALLTGKVLSSPPGGPTLVQTATGQVSLPAVGNLQTGAQVSLRPAQTQQPTTPGGPQTGPQQLTTPGAAWTALQDAHKLLVAANVGTTTPIPTSTIPTTGPQLATGMAFFLNALFHGSLPEWLGRDAIRMLQESDKQDLLKRLGDDFSQMSRLANEPTSGEWRMVMLPLLDDRTLQQIRLYFREHGATDDDSTDSPGTRFVIEASLSQLGAIQLDGFVRPARFDLMVRTHEELPERMRIDIGALFDAANREFSSKGDIDFQIQNPFGVKADDADTAAGVYA